jgi:putative oxidoreductase
MDHYGPTVLRLVVGATFVAHGAQKLFGVWGGAGLAAAALIVTMLGAIWNVHSPNGFFMNWAMTPGKGHGIEFNVVLIGALVCLMVTGPGALSFEHRRERWAESDRAGRARLRRKF